MKNNTLLLILGFLYLSTSAQQTDYKPIDVEVYQLKNGLTVILNEDHNLPQVFGSIMVRAGGKDDPKGATGMAHYQEHMLFKGTEDLGTTNWEAEKPHIDSIFRLYDKLGNESDPDIRKNIQTEINEESLKANEFAIPNELFNLIKSIGGTGLNAGTGTDFTIFYNSFPPTQIEKWIDLYSHRFENPVFRSFQAELEVVYEEKNMYSDQFMFSLLENFNRNFFRYHPYGQQTLIGTIEDLKNPSLSKMYDFFKTWYVPNNMALVMVGDFDKNLIKPLIEEKFGKWERKEIPQRPVYEEKPFNGRELVEMKLSPVKLAILGFRTIPAGHPDEIALSVCNAVLSNQGETGLLDKLTQDNKVIASQAFSMPYNDHGVSIIFVVPKILGQKLSSAEQLVLAELKKLKTGDFDSTLVEKIKSELYRNYLQSMESNSYKGNMFATAFGRYQTIDNLLQYPNKLMAITKADIVNIAQKYYGDNYLAFYSKMGFPKKQKIEKPGYKPLAAKKNETSVYAKHFSAIPQTNQKQTFVDFDKDVDRISVSEGLKLNCVKNPVNNVFSLTVNFQVGHKNIPELKYAVDAMNYAFPEGSSLDKFKAAIAGSGCAYSILGNESYTTVEITGFDSHFDESVALIGSLMENPSLEQSKVENLYDAEKTNRKLERNEPENVADALLSYVKYGKLSEYIQRLSLSEIKALQAGQLVESFKSVYDYGADIHYVGNLDPEKVATSCKATFKATGAKKVDTPVVMDLNQYAENTVYFVHKKKATQSNIYFFANGPAYNPGNQADIDAFNLYFGGDFSGLVLQEIREYRSMAYRAGAKFVTPLLKGKETYFIGNIGTQADKTIEAITVFDSLVRFMPSKAERTEMIQQYLMLSATSKRPHFRDLSEQITAWQKQGFQTDPVQVKQKAYENLKFDNIEQFYKNNLAKKPVVICIVGDKNQINTKELNKFGKMVFVKESELFSK